jgi:cell division protein FtsI/penicillin-binding protein 2
MRKVVGLLAIGLTTALAAPVALAKREGREKDDIKLESIKVRDGRAKASGEGTREVGLTVDPALQAEVDRILDASKAPSGAVVVSDVKTGRILAWASRGNEGDMVRKAKYPGASLFKIVTTTALLESGKVRLGDAVCFQGGESRLSEADIKPGCHSGDNKTAFEFALGRSINPVFGRLAIKHLTPTSLGETARSFGIGAEPPLDLPADKTSIKLPSDDLGFARAAAGFGDAKMSPLQALFMMQTIANGGEKVRLHVTGNAADVPRVSLGQAFKKETADKLVKMLEVTTRSGTSAKAFAPIEGRPRLSVAGKTGTLMFEKPKRLVSWFAGFAPSRKPEIAVAVMLANDEKWWRKGNEVARDVFDAYFELKANQP